MLPEKAIKEFKEIYFKKYGIELSEENVKNCAEFIHGLYVAVYSKLNYKLKPNS